MPCSTVHVTVVPSNCVATHSLSLYHQTLSSHLQALQLVLTSWLLPHLAPLQNITVKEFLLEL